MLLDITDKELIYCLCLTDLKHIDKYLHYWKREIEERVRKGYIKNEHDDLVYWCIGVTNGWLKP